MYHIKVSKTIDFTVLCKLFIGGNLKTTDTQKMSFVNSLSSQCTISAEILTVNKFLEIFSVSF